MTEHLEAFVDDDGIVRHLGNNERPEGLVHAWPVYGEADEAAIVPRGDWAGLIAKYAPGPVDPHLPPTHDQNGYGMCNASATSAAFEAARNAAGLPYVKLSAGDLYGRINGGRDQGSLLEDGLKEAMNNGIASVDDCPYLDWRGNHPAAREGRKKFRVLEAALCPTFGHCMSAVLRGWKLISGIPWYQNYKPDADGWLVPGRGSWGGHAIFGFKPAMRGDEFGIWHRQSWGNWSPKTDNCFVISESQYGRSIGGWWAIRGIVQEDSGFPQPA